MRGSEFSHTFQEFFANPRQHLCQSSQLFHVEQFSAELREAFAWKACPEPAKGPVQLFHVEHFEVT